MYAAYSKKRAPSNAVKSDGRMVTVPASSGGLNAVDAFTSMAPTDAVSLINCAVDPYGLTVREGYREFATNIGAGALVGTVMSYMRAIDGNQANALVNGVVSPMRVLDNNTATPLTPVGAGKLFAAEGSFIYDISAGGPGPWVAEPGVAGLVPYWNWWNVQTPGGSFLTVTNWGGGYSFYNGVVWTTPVLGDGTLGTIAGVNPNRFVYHFAFKGRLYFIEKDSTRMWYLPPGQLTGVALSWDFGIQMKRGGALQVIASWTQDAGDGVDDYFVACGSEGDLIVYRGFDPNNAPTDWALNGVWFVGKMPYGHRVFDTSGADLNILTEYGLVQVSSVLGGKPLDDNASRKIDPLLLSVMKHWRSTPGWTVESLPSRGLLVINLPNNAGVGGNPNAVYNMFAMTTQTRAWYLAQGIPAQCWASHDGVIYFGTVNGRVCIGFDGPLDDVKLGSTAGNPIMGQWIHAINPLGAPGMNKIFCMVRPNIVTTGKLNLKVTALADFSNRAYASVPTLPAIDFSIWDSATWDAGLWSGQSRPITEWLGVNGTGYAGACQLDFAAAAGTRFAVLDWWVRPGGPLT